MARLLCMLRYLTAILFLTVVLLCCWQAIDIYADGITAAEHESIFRADDVRDRLSVLAGPLSAFGIVGGLAIILHAQAPGKAISGHFREARVYTSNKTNPVKGKNILRMLLLCAAIVFIMLGAMNGGAYDVLVKAINICTECIGLG